MKTLILGANEWITHGKSGLIVPPEDIDALEGALREVLTNDGLVDQAASVNKDIARQRLDSAVIQPKVIDFYEHVCDSPLGS